ncbi:MAG: UDP-N-acetylmuramoyl-L-alanine--D-glutamate ligase [Bacilli bacterium]
MKNNIYEFLNNKKILILGFGREGKSTYHFLRNYFKDVVIGIADKNDIENKADLVNVNYYIGDNYLDSIKEYDVVIKAPGVIILDYVNNEDKKKITSQTDLFLKFCQNTVIGITGTKGKSTTSSLVYHVLKDSDYDALLVGNIGVPSFDKIDEINENTIIVYELSCHQLEFVKSSPNIAIILNLFEEHLDHYLDLNHYLDAKKNVFKYQSNDDYFLYVEKIQHLSNDELKKIKAKVVKVTMDEKKNYNIKTNLIGEHNVLNILVCINVAKILKMDIAKVLTSISTFIPLKHRLEYVGKNHGINFYNDSIATASEAVISAIRSFNKVDTIIIGGMERNLHYENLVNFIENSSIDNVILLPNTNLRIKNIFDSINSKKKLYVVKDMDEAVKIAKEVTPKEGVCLLSPAAASYGFYKNFEERGDHFRMLVIKDRDKE